MAPAEMDPGYILAQIIYFCLTAPSHHLNHLTNQQNRMGLVSPMPLFSVNTSDQKISRHFEAATMGIESHIVSDKRYLR